VKHAILNDSGLAGESYLYSGRVSAKHHYLGATGDHQELKECLLVGSMKEEGLRGIKTSQTSQEVGGGSRDSERETVS